MVSATILKQHFFKLVKLAEHDGIELEYGYMNRVYKLTIERTTRTYKPFRGAPRTRTKPPKGKVALETSVCDNCGHLRVGKICINKKCDASAGSKAKP